MMQKPKILAADNTKVALRYMETILGDIYDVTLVQTGMSVLDCLKSEIPDLILMNANMFGMDGYEVLRRIKEDKETKETLFKIIDMIAKERECNTTKY